MALGVHTKSRIILLQENLRNFHVLQTHQSIRKTQFLWIDSESQLKYFCWFAFFHKGTGYTRGLCFCQTFCSGTFSGQLGVWFTVHLSCAKKWTWVWSLPFCSRVQPLCSKMLWRLETNFGKDIFRLKKCTGKKTLRENIGCPDLNILLLEDEHKPFPTDRGQLGSRANSGVVVTVASTHLSQDHLVLEYRSAWALRFSHQKSLTLPPFCCFFFFFFSMDWGEVDFVAFCILVSKNWLFNDLFQTSGCYQLMTDPHVRNLSSETDFVGSQFVSGARILCDPKSLWRRFPVEHIAINDKFQWLHWWSLSLNVPRWCLKTHWTGIWWRCPGANLEIAKPFFRNSEPWKFCMVLDCFVLQLKVLFWEKLSEFRGSKSVFQW